MIQLIFILIMNFLVFQIGRGVGQREVLAIWKREINTKKEVCRVVLETLDEMVKEDSETSTKTDK